MATAADEPPVSLAGSPALLPFQGRARREGAVQEQDGRAYLPPRFHLKWSPIEELLGCAAPAAFRERIEGDAWQLVAQSWEAHPTAREKVAHEWRNLWRRALQSIQDRPRAEDAASRYLRETFAGFVFAFARRGKKGRPSSLTWFDSIILWFDCSFPKLECKGNSSSNPKSWSGQFPEIIFEVVRQLSAYLWTDELERALWDAGIEPAGERGSIGLPSGVNVLGMDDRAKRSALNGIGRRIHELRKGERRDAQGMRQLDVGESFWSRR